MTARIRESYFQELLRQDDAIHAVATISGFWMDRLNAEAPRLGLSQPEYVVQLVMIYTGEVGNGGHGQYFQNRGTGRLMDTASALEQVSLVDLSKVLTEAGRFAGQEGETALTGLQRLDRAAWKELGAVDQALQRYMASNQAQLLRSERGLID